MFGVDFLFFRDEVQVSWGPARPDVRGAAGACWACMELALASFLRVGDVYRQAPGGPSSSASGHLKRPNTVSKECGLKSGSETLGDPF